MMHGQKNIKKLSGFNYLYSVILWPCISF